MAEPDTLPAPAIPAAPWAHDGPFDRAQAELGGFAHVEIMGHTERWAYVREVRVFGKTMVEILSPLLNRAGDEVKRVIVELQSPDAIFRLTSATKADVLANAERDWTEPLHERQLPPAERDSDGEEDGSASENEAAYDEDPSSGDMLP